VKGKKVNIAVTKITYNFFAVLKQNRSKMVWCIDDFLCTAFLNLREERGESNFSIGVSLSLKMLLEASKGL
jgi:hypothetical protein